MTVAKKKNSDRIKKLIRDGRSVALARFSHGVVEQSLEWRMAAAIDEQQKALKKCYALIRDFVDDEDCWFDHHGGCQAHGYLSLKPGELCPHAEAKALLAKL